MEDLLEVCSAQKRMEDLLEVFFVWKIFYRAALHGSASNGLLVMKELLEVCPWASVGILSVLNLLEVFRLQKTFFQILSVYKRTSGGLRSLKDPQCKEDLQQLFCAKKIFIWSFDGDSPQEGSE